MRLVIRAVDERRVDRRQPAGVARGVHDRAVVRGVDVEQPGRGVEDLGEAAARRRGALDDQAVVEVAVGEPRADEAVGGLGRDAAALQRQVRPVARRDQDGAVDRDRDLVERIEVVPRAAHDPAAVQGVVHGDQARALADDDDVALPDLPGVEQVDVGVAHPPGLAIRARAAAVLPGVEGLVDRAAVVGERAAQRERRSVAALDLRRRAARARDEDGDEHDDCEGGRAHEQDLP
jgi:hypothetical protein